MRGRRLWHSRWARVAMAAASAVFAAATIFLAGRKLEETGWPLTRGHPALLVAVGALVLLAYALKAYGWRRLFAASERPRPLALAAANGAASVGGIVLPGRFDDAIRIAIVRRSSGCPAGIRALCLSLVMLGLIDSVALAPLALATAVFPGIDLGVRVGLAVVGAAGLASAGLIFVLPRVVGCELVRRFRLGRWLSPRTTTLRHASEAWGLVSACWLVRAVALFLLLGALGLGYSFPLALLVLCAGAAAAALPIGPAGAATQVGAGAAVMIASGIGASQAIAVAIAVQVIGVLAGGGILLLGAVQDASVRITASRARA